MFLRFSSTFESTISHWQQAKLLRPLDVALLRAMPQAGALPEPLLLYLMLASAQLAQGHLCLDFAEAAKDPLQLLPVALRQRPQARILEQFCGQHPPAQAASQLISYPALVSTDLRQTSQPFVLRANRLYLRRYAADEQSIAGFINGRRDADLQLRQQLEPEALRQLLSLLFPPEGNDVNWQQQACALAASSYFAVITGGPGTGKTTTVLKLLLLLLRQSASGLHIVLAAPTGKAAARLTESLTQSRLQLAQSLPQLADLLPQLPARAQTVHRLLAPKPDGSGFRFFAGQLLPADVVIVDEASMLDVSLFAALVRALPPQCRLILLGDKDQLASVEAGAVLAEICRHAEAGGYSQQTADWLAQLTGQPLPVACLTSKPDALDQHVVMLRKSHRFNEHSGIGQLARAVNVGDNKASLLFQAAAVDTDVDTVAGAAITDLQAVLLAKDQLAQQVSARMVTLLAPYLQLLQQPVTSANMAAQAQALHQQFAQVQLLCALRQGPAGVETINLALEQRLAQSRLIGKHSGWYHGRPVIVLQNDYSTGLMNGDIGICLAVEHEGQPQLRVAFLQPDSGNNSSVRWFLPGRLPQLETAFALTVHKSQGSEFNHAVLLLPPTESPVLTRELIYTAITRARTQFSLLLTDWQVFDQAVARRIVRQGGLRLV
ncbi:MAG: exodeoxyribonuclease V subunit alpha [Rheinheimera sp.]|nr:exodeoxyribonuclease V subunit alpha [Rheinheimera sp.]